MIVRVDGAEYLVRQSSGGTPSCFSAKTRAAATTWSVLYWSVLYWSVLYGKPADEMNIRFLQGQGRIALEQCLIVGAGYRVVGLAGYSRNTEVPRLVCPVRCLNSVILV
jgi:hypothetical protein